MLLLFKSIKIENNPDDDKKRNNSELPKRRNSSRVRDHLANERTYLAWMRTAISLMGFGVVIVRLRFFKPPISTTPGNGWKLGLIFSLVGLVTVLLSTQHYFAVRHDIDEDTYEPADRWVLLFSLAVLILGAGIIYYVFTLPLDPINTLVFD
jgi:putative membrane protein